MSCLRLRSAPTRQSGGERWRAHRRSSYDRSAVKTKANSPGVPAGKHKLPHTGGASGVPRGLALRPLRMSLVMYATMELLS